MRPYRYVNIINVLLHQYGSLPSYPSLLPLPHTTKVNCYMNGAMWICEDNKCFIISTWEPPFLPHTTKVNCYMNEATWCVKIISHQ